MHSLMKLSKTSLGDEVEIDRAEILRRRLRTLDIVPYQTVDYVLRPRVPQRVHTWLPGGREHDPLISPITNC
jgi:hypothetical protein